MHPPVSPQALSRWLDPIERALEAALPADGTPLSAAARYVFGWEDADGRPTSAGGKRLRPALALAAAHAVGGAAAVDMAMPGAVAVELIHNFSLVHDDIQDHDIERHGRPTAWAIHGEAQAINVGDYLHVKAVHALSDAPGPPERRMRALGVLNRATTSMLTGQWSDIAFESHEAVTMEEYLAMVTGKSAALFAAPLEIGAILGGAVDGTASAFGEWGTKLGLAFQCHDDFLGIWGDPAATGKSNRSDIVRRKKSMPIVAGLGDAGAADVIRAVFALEAIDDAAAREVVGALEACGADTTTREASAQYAAAAAEQLEGIEIADFAKDELRAVADYLVGRLA